MPAAADGAGGAVTDDSGIDYGALAGGGNGGNHSDGGVGEWKRPHMHLWVRGCPRQLPRLRPGRPPDQNHARRQLVPEDLRQRVLRRGRTRPRRRTQRCSIAVVAVGVLKRMNIPLPEVAQPERRPDRESAEPGLGSATAETLTGSATVGGVTVRATAQPRSARWTFGDVEPSSHARQVSPGQSCPTRPAPALIPGFDRPPLNPARRIGSNVTVTWDAPHGRRRRRWWSPCATTPTTTAAVRVAEVQAINDRAGG